MAQTAQERRRAQAKLARQRKAGTLPKSNIGKKARAAATFIGPFHPDDRDTVIDIKMHGWWDNDASLNDYRHEGDVISVYNYAVDLSNRGVPSHLINITQGSTQRRFYVYAARTS